MHKPVSNRVFSSLVAIPFLIALVSCNPDQGEIRIDQESPPNDLQLNILFLMSDQHRGDRMGASGAKWIETPNMDRLAAEGVLFTNAYSSVPSCLPARGRLLTGQSPWQSGQLSYRPIPTLPYTMPQLFTDAGYRTHAVGKNHFSPKRNKQGYQSVELEEAWTYAKNRHQGIGDYALWFEKELPDEDLNASGLHYTDHRGGVFPFEDQYHATHWTAERAIEFLNTHAPGEPWFLKVSFQRPHPPFDPPQRWLDQYADVDIPEANVGDWAEEKYAAKTGSLYELKNPTSGNFPADEIAASRRAYYAAISYVDEQLGQVLQALEDRGEIENTLILYTSDHGDMMGDHHMWRKCRPYEGSANIPMIVRWPDSLELDIERGQLRSELVELRDVLPTFLDAAGLAIPDAVDGLSMLDVLKGKPWRQTLDLEHAQIYEPDNSWTALTDGRYKYIYFTLTGQQQLFDLNLDPNEMTDLASVENQQGNEKLLLSWRAKMVEHLQARGEQWVKNDTLVVQEKPIFFGNNHPSFQQETASRVNKP